MEKKTLWTRNYTTITVATALGALGNVALSFAMSFFVFDETGSTLASAILFAIQMIPGVVIPLFVSPVLDRYPRKPFLVLFDGLFALIYLLAGIWLLLRPFNYMEYLVWSLVFAFGAVVLAFALAGIVGVVVCVPLLLRAGFGALLMSLGAGLFCGGIATVLAYALRGVVKGTARLSVQIWQGIRSLFIRKEAMA